jgi:hypothetical protein
MLNITWCVPLTQMLPPGLRTRRASLSHRSLNAWSLSKEPSDRSHAPALYRYAAVREPVRRVREHGVHAAGGHEAHELDAVGEVDHRPRLAEGFDLPQFHTPFVGVAGPKL